MAIRPRGRFRWWPREWTLHKGLRADGVHDRVPVFLASDRKRSPRCAHGRRRLALDLPVAVAAQPAGGMATSGHQRTDPRQWRALTSALK